MNMNIQMLLNKQLSRNQRMEELRYFAGHQKEKTTLQYLDYSKNEAERYEAYDYHGDKLLGWLSDYGVISIHENEQQCKVQVNWRQP